MTERPAKALFPNPFYVLLLLASTLFVVTTLAYLAGPVFPGRAGWLDRNGAWAIGGEVVVMIASGLLAMATDRWFPSRPDRNGSSADS